ncbi:hypothetical protein EXIGLDRAFT_613125 [Exidia glandulosa HHB12029]|uniref:Uncharacterized protein n=1 Tax=Exidia glandulosa HHB12029 TaxID=1314781 RepID=A0A165IGS2_EXIGL|nr:hypothetical protein EXIGLDRAFT_613125 [Exidia glandulosa HHB12029]
MAQPSSTHRERSSMAQPSSTHRERSSSHHHHRTISSTTLLLVLSLILAVLAVMLSIPRSAQAAEPTPSGILGMFSSKRNQNVISREAAVAQRESEVAKREADFLAGVPAGVSIGTCLPCTSTSTVVAVPTEPVTIIKEVVREMETLNPPWWKDPGIRAEEVLEREARISEREKEVARREEVIGKRESDATRREAWIMENLMASDAPIAQTTEEYVYEDLPPPRRPAAKVPPVLRRPEQRASTRTQTVTIPVPPPAHTRLAANPSPEIMSTATEPAARTTAVEYVVDDTVDEGQPRTVTVIRERTARPTPHRRWFGGW